MASCFVSTSTCADKWSSLSDNTWGIEWSSSSLGFVRHTIVQSFVKSRIVSASYISVSVETLLPERDLVPFGIVIVVFIVYSQLDRWEIKKFKSRPNSQYSEQRVNWSRLIS